MTTTTTRRKRRTPEQMIADLEAEIVAVKQRAASPSDGPRRANRSPRRPISAPSVEDVLQAAAAELGLSRSIAILDEQRRALCAVGVGRIAGREIVPQPPPYEITPPAPRPRGGMPELSFPAYERMAIDRALAECGGDVLAAANLLNTSKSSMYRRIKKSGATGVVTGPDPNASEPVSFEAYERAAVRRALAEAGGDRLVTARALRVGKSTPYRKVEALELGG